jgi:hypothetical protein
MIQAKDAAIAEAKRNHEKELARIKAVHEKEVETLRRSAKRNTADVDTANGTYTEALRKAMEDLRRTRADETRPDTAGTASPGEEPLASTETSGV